MTSNRVPFHAGPLQAAVEIPGVTDVLVNGPDEVWVDRGAGLERVAVRFGGAGEVRELAVRLASIGGRRLDDASPLVDARLPDGTRLHAALPPVVEGCATISLRTVRSRSLTLDDLVLSGTTPEAVARLLGALVAARANLLITGATGSGKTTLLASLLTLVDPTERIVVIEEAGEVSPDHPHVIRLVERRANVDGAGEVGLPRLVREALRMRPDRIVLGECRGPEVRDVLSALNTGHRGSMATLHANAARDVPARLAALGALAEMTRRATDLYAAAAFDAVIHLERGGGRRRVAEIATLRLGGGRNAPTRLVAETALAVGPRGELAPGPAWDAVAEIAGWVGRDADNEASAA